MDKKSLEFKKVYNIYYSNLNNYVYRMKRKTISNVLAYIVTVKDYF
jgi:hypothetical protein